MRIIINIIDGFMLSVFVGIFIITFQFADMDINVVAFFARIACLTGIVFFIRYKMFEGVLWNEL